MNTVIGYVVTFFVVVMLAVSPAQAILMTAEDGRLAASADFSFVGADLRDLQVILTNTSTYDVMGQSQVLTGVFFSLSGGSFTPISATLTGRSTVLFDGSPADGNVGGEWAYATGLSGAPGGANSGISAAGLGLFGDANFNGPTLDIPVAVNGVSYGITSAGDNPAIGNAGVTGRFPLIQNSVTFLLRYSGSFEDLSAISNVSFQYGTSLAEPNVGVPEPGTLALLGMGLVGIGIFRRRK